MERNRFEWPWDYMREGRDVNTSASPRESAASQPAWSWTHEPCPSRPPEDEPMPVQYCVTPSHPTSTAAAQYHLKSWLPVPCASSRTPPSSCCSSWEPSPPPAVQRHTPDTRQPLRRHHQSVSSLPSVYDWVTAVGDPTVSAYLIGLLVLDAIELRLDGRDVVGAGLDVFLVVLPHPRRGKSA